MQVSRPIDDDFRRFRDDPRVAVAPVFGASYPKAANEIRLDVMQHCGLCGVPVRQSTAKTLGKRLCQGCRRSELQRQSSLEDIRPASPMAGKPNTLIPVKNDGRVHPSWTAVDSEAETEPETSEPSSAERFHPSTRYEDAGSFRSMEVLSCFRSEVHRGLRLAMKAATAEKWHMWWAVLLSMLLLPTILTLMVVVGRVFLVVSTWVAIAAAVVCPLACINPIIFNSAMDS